MSDTTPSGIGEQDTDINLNGGETTTDAPESDDSNGEQEEEASAADLLSEAQELIEDKAKPKEEKTRDNFLKEEESIKNDALLLRSEGKTNMDIIRELRDSGTYREDQINRLKKLMVNGQLDTQGTEEEDDFDKKYNARRQQEKQSEERSSAIDWFTSSYAKELGINSKNNAVAIESRKKLIAEANIIYNQTIPEHKNFKRSLQLAASHLGLTDKVKIQEALKRSSSVAKTYVPDTGTPQKTEKLNYKYSEIAKIRARDPKEAQAIMKKARSGKVKLVDDTNH